MKEKQGKEGKEERKGAVKVNLRRRQQSPLAGVCFQTEARRNRAERAFCSGCTPLARFVPNGKRRRDGTLSSTGTLRLPGQSFPVTGRRKGDVDRSSERKTKRRKERKQEGGWRDS